MTTYYTQIPTLEMRVTAAQLIVVGLVQKVTETHVDYYDREPFVRTTYEVAGTGRCSKERSRTEFKWR